MTKIKKISVLILIIMIAILPLSGVFAGINDEGYVSISYTNTEPTNQNIEIEIEASDELSGIKELKDGEDNILDLTLNKHTFIAEQNGDYTFKVYDNAGNETIALVSITNIDKIDPSLTLTPSTIDPTNQNIIITIEAEDVENQINKVVKIDEGVESELSSFIDGKGSYEVEENGTYSFKAYDEAGNSKTETITIDNINKILPILQTSYIDVDQEWTNQDIAVEVTAKDKDGEVLDVIGDFIFTENTTHTFTTTDKWGNTNSFMVTVNKIDKTKPNITIIVK